MSVNLDAGIKFSPLKSQVVLLGFLVFSIACVFTGFYFLLNDIDGMWIPFSFGIVLSLITTVGWFKSQSSIDIENLHPINIEDSAGNKLSTHSGIINNPSDVQQLTQAFNLFAHREKLPNPDGIIDKNFNPIKNTEKEAADKIREVEKHIYEQANEFSNYIKGDGSDKQLTQESIPSPEDTTR